MILHLIAPYVRMMRDIVAQFEAVNPRQNYFVGTGDFIPSGDRCEGVVLVHSVDEFRVACSGLQIDAVIFHGLLWHGADYLYSMRDDIPMAWYVWGFEAYDYWPALRNRMLTARTTRLMSAFRRDSAKNLMRPIKWWMSGRLREVRRIADRCTYCVCQYREEYERFAETGLLRKSGYHFGMVLRLETLIEGCTPRFDDEGDIQVGNSATATNNHIDVFLRLAAMNLGRRRVVVPLSYGDAPYRRKIIAEGERLLGPAFLPITETKPLPEYNALMAGCSVVVMNHLRQQGIGTVMAALWRGAAVFLSDPTMLSGYSRIGIELYSVAKQLDDAQLVAVENRAEKRGAVNRAVMQREFGWSRLSAATADLIQKLKLSRH